MTAVSTTDTALTWDVLVTPGIPMVTGNPPPGTTQMLWSPISSTLITGQRDAILVDAFLTIAQAESLADWVTARGKNLTTIYITHGHADHFFGLGTLLAQFPRAMAVATPSVVQLMRQQASPAVLGPRWEARFPGQVPRQPTIAEEFTGNVLELEGRELVIVPVGHTDTDNTTCLHVPSLGLVVAGDVAYNDVHQHLGESNAKTRQEWIAALDTIEALNPRAVVAGHKRPGTDNGPGIIETTRQYIRDFDRIFETTSTARELYDAMLACYPTRVNRGILWLSALAVRPS
ncbi:MAG TPA: MBL fold metallo-hydrolase [Gemmatimonadaceae bacterium]|nr:MBL fold metallo-hydrolase [Gemmatimonadaceae bacterium]